MKEKYQFWTNHYYIVKLYFFYYFRQRLQVYIRYKPVLLRQCPIPNQTGIENDMYKTGIQQIVELK